MSRIIKIVLIIVVLLLLVNYTGIIKVYGASDLYSWSNAAESFVESADPNINFKDEDLESPSTLIYNVLSSIGIIISLAVGGILGIKYMMTSVEEKAEVKETILPYLIGCFIIFGAFGIWKIIINTFYN